jgi:protein FAM50
MKKKKKAQAKGKLSFVGDDDEEVLPRRESNSEAQRKESKRLGANTSVVAPKVMTKSTLLREAQTKEQLRKEFLAFQGAVKATEFVIPFVFFDGTNIPGGSCKIKKGDHVWLFLDRSRKVGAELGVRGSGERPHTRREWARVSVDDLMLVRGNIIIPHVSPINLILDTC